MTRRRRANPTSDLSAPHIVTFSYFRCCQGNSMPAHATAADLNLVSTLDERAPPMPAAHALLIPAALLDACVAQPLELAPRLGLDASSRHSQRYLTLYGPQAEVNRALHVRDWDTALHVPLRRAFTLIRGLVPYLQRSDRQGQLMLVVPDCAMVPDYTRAPASILGRALVGLFEALRAELRHGATTVILLVTAADEPPAVLASRMRTQGATHPCTPCRIALMTR